MTRIQRDANRGRRAAQWIVRVGLGGGTVCLLVGAALHSGAGPDAPLATWAREWRATLRHLVPAAFALLGTMLMSVGAVFALLDRLGVLVAVAVPRHPVEALEPPHDLPSRESRSGDSVPVRTGLVEAPATPDRGAGPRRAHDGAPRSLPVWSGTPEGPPPRGTVPANSADARPHPALRPALPGAAAAHGAEPGRAPFASYSSRRPAEGDGRRGAEPPSPHGAAAPAAAEATGDSASLGAETQGTRAAEPGFDEAAGTGSTDSAEPPPHHPAAPAFGDRAGPDPSVRSPRPHSPVDEAGALSFPADEPAPPEPSSPEPPQPGDLIDAWDEYRRNGDGHYGPRGLQEVLDQWELAARVVHGDRVDAGGAVLVVEMPGTPSFYVLPSFNMSPRAVAGWFDDASSGALTGRTQRVARVARGRWLESGTGRFEVVERGEVR